MLRFSATLRSLQKASSWCTIATPASIASRGELKLKSLPSMCISPLSGLWIPASTLPKVDLPAPFSPISPWHSPRATSRVTSLSATTPPKVLVISLNWMKVSDIDFGGEGRFAAGPPPPFKDLS